MNESENSGEQVGQVLPFCKIKQAVDRIEGGIIHTPLCESKLSKFMDYNTYLKCENLQFTGSCAERGVRNAFLALGEKLCERGLIVPSSGNMAMAAAYHGSSLGVPVSVVMPDRTPPVLAQHCSELGANVVLCGDNLDEAYDYACKMSQETKQSILCSDDLLVMAGNGTVGVEIIAQLPETDAVIVPVSSGGLLAGVLVACKKLKPTCLVYGAECTKAPTMMKALQAGHPVQVDCPSSLADGLSASSAGNNAFATIKGRLDRMLEVDESYVARAIISMLERERLVADGAGVCALAAVMQGLVPELKGKRAVCIISSGNIDSTRLSRSIQRGLAVTGRLLKFAIPVPDHRCGLEILAKNIADESAVVKSIVTEQMFLHGDVGSTWATVVVETANDDHAVIIKDHLRELYPNMKIASFECDVKIKNSLR